MARPLRKITRALRAVFLWVFSPSIPFPSRRRVRRAARRWSGRLQWRARRAALLLVRPPPPGLPRRKRLLHYRRGVRHAVWTVAGLVLLIGLGTRPAASAVRGWQSRRLAAEAEDAIRRGDAPAAQRAAAAAYGLRPADPAPLRAAARYLTRAGDLRCLELWRQLEAAGALTTADRRDYAGAASVAQLWPKAAQLLREVASAPDGNTPSDRLALAALAAATGDLPAADEGARALLAAGGLTERERWRAADLLANSREPATRALGWRELAVLARAGGAQSLLALRRLSGRPPGDAATLPDAELVAALESHPEGGASAWLLARSVELRADPSRRATALAAAWNHFEGKADPDLVELTRWLLAVGEPAEALRAADEPLARRRRDAALLRAEAFSVLSRWGGPARVPPPVPPAAGAAGSFAPTGRGLRARRPCRGRRDTLARRGRARRGGRDPARAGGPRG